MTLASTIYTYLKFRTVSGTLKFLQSQVHLNVTELTTAFRSRKGPRFSAPVTTSSRLAPIWPTMRDHSDSHINIGKKILRNFEWENPSFENMGLKKIIQNGTSHTLVNLQGPWLFCCKYILRGRKKTQEIVDNGHVTKGKKKLISWNCFFRSDFCREIKVKGGGEHYMTNTFQIRWWFAERQRNKQKKWRGSHFSRRQIQTRPSKKCEFCIYLLDKSLISQGF